MRSSRSELSLGDVCFPVNILRGFGPPLMQADGHRLRVD